MSAFGVSDGTVDGAPRPSTTSTWADIERIYPDAPPMWDLQGGPEWLRGRSSTWTIVITGDTVAIGCGDEAPYGWALWIDLVKQWVFI